MPLTYEDWLREARGKHYLAGATVKRLEADWPNPTEWQSAQIALAKRQEEIAKEALDHLLEQTVDARRAAEHARLVRDAADGDPGEAGEMDVPEYAARVRRVR